MTVREYSHSARFCSTTRLPLSVIWKYLRRPPLLTPPQYEVT